MRTSARSVSGEAFRQVPTERLLIETNAPSQDLDLRLAKLAVQGLELAVDAADSDVVQVNQRQFTNARVD